MNIDYIKHCVETIKSAQGDCEFAHGMEDELRKQFIQHVADGDFGELSVMAKEVLKTLDLDFPRYCA